MGDSWIPSDGRERRPLTIQLFDEEGKPIGQKDVVWVEGIERLITPSKLKKYCGLMPDQQRVEGRKLDFNKDLKTTLYRLAVFSFMMKEGNKYRAFYDAYKTHLMQRFARDGIKVLPTPKGRYCPVCETDMMVKAAMYCPECGGPLGKKGEPHGVKWKGHVHMMAQRRMLGMFVCHLWEIYRRAVGLATRVPFPIEFGDHQTIITPEQMVDS